MSIEEYKEKLSTAHDYLKAENFNFNNAKSLFEELANAGYYVAQEYMLAFSCIENNENEIKKWHDEVSKIEKKRANKIIVHFANGQSAAYNQSIAYLKTYDDFSTYYRFDLMRKLLK